MLSRILTPYWAKHSGVELVEVFFPPEPTRGAYWVHFLARLFWGYYPVSLLIGMNIYIVTDDNLADVFGPLIWVAFQGSILLTTCRTFGPKDLG